MIEDMEAGAKKNVFRFYDGSDNPNRLERDVAEFFPINSVPQDVVDLLRDTKMSIVGTSSIVSRLTDLINSK